MTVIDKLFHWVYYVMKLSMIYVVLLISGFFLLGFSPANASLMTLYNKHRTVAEKYTFSEAFAEFKSTFKLSNSVFLIVAMIALGLLYTLWGLSHMTPSLVVYFF
ncbi:YesL family protein [Streptococcus iniae]|nr:YesL family protein [Streptococcus iniae]